MLIYELLKLWHHLSNRRRRQVASLLFLIIITSLSEVISLGAIFPFLAALGNADLLFKEPYLQPIVAFLHIETSVQLVQGLAIAFILAVLLASFLRLLTLRTRTQLAASVGADLSSDIYRTTLRQPYSFHLQHNSSDLIQTITGDTTELTNGVLLPSLTVASNLILVPALAITLIWMDKFVASVVSVVLLSTYVLIYQARRRLLRLNSRVIACAGQRKIKVVQEGIGGIRDILLAKNYSFFERMYFIEEKAFRQAIAANQVIAMAPKYVIEAMAVSAIAILALSLGQNGDFSQAIPVLGSLTFGAKRLLPSLQELFASISKIEGTREALSRVLIALQRPVSPQPLNSTADTSFVLKEEIKFENVWFRYSENDDWVLRDLNLSIKAKTTVGIIGTTGSGKSTTADLLLGVLTPQKGKVFIDGITLDGDTFEVWQNTVAHVPQSIFLSDGTIAENIAFGIPSKDIDTDKVRQAASLAQLDKFIESLPLKYSTYVGERGIRLSGGQQQRIGIARALYKKASVIIFDEATSSLDSSTEEEVMSAIESLSQDFTIILIAHRLSTLKKCDMIATLSHGRALINA